MKLTKFLIGLLIIIMLVTAFVIPLWAESHTEQSYAIPMTSVLKKLKQNQNIILIDVRAKDKFEKFRIPGSVNIPLYAIKTKPFLKAKTIVLVNNGFQYTQLEKECSRLIGQGFKPKILTGGLNYWKNEKGPLEGDPFAQKQINKVSAREFFQGKDLKNLFVINASKEKSEVAKELLPNSVHMPESSSLSPLCLERAKRTGETQDSPILIFTKDGKGYGRIEKAAKQAELKNVFYLEGGLDSYSRFLHNLALSRAPRDSRVKTVSKCPKCGEKDKDEE